MRRTKTLTQCLAAQDAASSAIALLQSNLTEAGDPTTRSKLAAALASMIKGWDTCAARARLLRGKSWPAAYKPAVKAPRTKRKSNRSPLPPLPTEPQAPEPTEPS